MKIDKNLVKSTIEAIDEAVKEFERQKPYDRRGVRFPSKAENGLVESKQKLYEAYLKDCVED